MSISHRPGGFQISQDEPRPVDSLSVDGLPCGVITFGDDGIVIAINATLCAMLGYDHASVEGGKFERLLTVAGRIFYQTHFFPLLKLHGKAEEIFLLLKTSSGLEIGALANAIRTEHGGAVVNTCVVVEVRERRRYEDELLRARRASDSANVALESRTRELELANQRLQVQASELELKQQELKAARAQSDEANRAKSQFLATMSHELRTPLNAIAGYVQLVELGVHGPVTDAQRHALKRVAKSQRHLLRLVNEVLNLARIESGHVQYNIVEVSLAQVLANVIPMIEPQMAAARIELTNSVRDDLVVKADGEKVEQILLNLLTNSVKFTPAGGRIELNGYRDKGRCRACISVIDSGIGIDQDKLVSIFDPFVQLSSRVDATAEGSGLGLAISREMARGLGGDIEVASTVGTGSEFTLWLPAWSQSLSEPTS